MQETLLTLRGIHRLTIAGCVTVLLLALTPSLAHRYQSALDELKQVETDFAEFQASPFESLMLEDEDAQIYNIIHEVILNDLKNAGGLETAWSFQADVADMPLPRIDSSHALVKRVEQSFDQLSLAAIHDLSVDPTWNKPIELIIPDPVELKTKLLELLVKTIPKRFKQISTDKTPHELNIQVRLTGRESGNEFDGKVGLMVSCGLDEEKPWLIGIDLVSASTREVGGYSNAYLVRQSLPACRPVWSEVHGLTVADARTLLKARKADTTSDVTVMGFSIPKHVALLLGPLATASLFLYLQLHIKHAIPRIRRNGWPVEDFPWIGFYVDNTSRRITLCTFVFLPLASCGSLTYSEWTLTGQFPWLVAGCTLFCTLSGIISLERIRSLPTDQEAIVQLPETPSHSRAA